MNNNHNFYDKLLDERIIFIHDEITNSVAADIVAKLLYLDSKSHDDIYLYINSPGGEVTSGFMIYDTMKYISSDIHTVALGICASMASLLLIAGTKGKRKMLENSRVMIHDVSGEFNGKFRDVMIEVNEMNKFHNKIIDIIKNNTSINYQDIENKISSDFWLNSNEALRLGVIDKVISENSNKI